MQLVDSDWPTNILAGSHFRAQETRALSPDGVCALARARLGTRLAVDSGASTAGAYISYNLKIDKRLARRRSGYARLNYDLPQRSKPVKIDFRF